MLMIMSRAFLLGLSGIGWKLVLLLQNAVTFQLDSYLFSVGEKKYESFLRHPIWWIKVGIGLTTERKTNVRLGLPMG